MKKGKKGYNLPPLRQAVLVYVAEHEPTSIRAVSIGMKKTYSSTHEAMTDLLELKYVVAKPSTKSHKKIWVTPEGAKRALLYGVDSKKMKTHANSFYDGDELIGFNAVADLDMFPPAAIQAQIALLNGQIPDGEQLTTVAKQLTQIFPSYIEKHPELEAELRTAVPQWDKIKDFVLGLFDEDS